MTTRTLRFALWALVFLALAAVVWVRWVQPMFEKSVALTIGPGDYHLTTTTGELFTEDTLKGKPSAVFFGFTHCPEVCPTTLGDIATWQEELGEGNQLRVYFVTVDPERDTIDQLREYVSWAPGVVGVSGTPEEIAKAIAAFRIFARKVPLDNGGYTMDHSANVLLFDKDGQLFEPIAYQEGFDRAVAKIRRMQAG
ncbi:SCO family protein [Seohaeicola nanhaiensis]|uniref:SCO family protein n=1 Tax=Seohaeicola nanhaiensis TaxID=1387282 RepID=A0ABV9KGM0_9RHOB